MNVRIKKCIKKILGRRIILTCYKIIIFLKVYIRFFKRLLSEFVLSHHSKHYPNTLQLPITYKCNFDCVMCGMKNMAGKLGFSSEELKKILNDRLFNNISGVGVNGGEPFILSDLELYIDSLFATLPKLKNVYIITNGYFTDKILNKSKIILAICHKHRAKLHLSISIDGIGEMQDIMRGKKGAFDHAYNTCLQILKKQNEYCDTFGVICTITKINVYHLTELDVWAKSNNLLINYNIATIHKRIGNEDKYQDFSVFTDEHARLMAAEFFYSKFLERKEEKYFGLYYMIHKGKRIALCAHKTNTVTLTPNGFLSYCATHSDELGNIYNEKAEKIFFSSKNLAYRKRLHNEFCVNCSHYSGNLTSYDFLTKYTKENMRNTIIF